MAKSKRSLERLPKKVMAEVVQLRPGVEEINEKEKEDMITLLRQRYDDRIKNGAVIKTLNRREPRPEDAHEIVIIDDDLIEYLSSIPNIEGQRKLSADHLDFLAERFYQCPILFQFALAVVGGEEFLINGNHTRYLLRMIKTLKLIGAPAVISRYHCKTKEEGTLLYRQFDSSKRAPGAMVQPTVCQVGSKLDPATVAAMMTGIEFVRYGTRNTLTPSEKSDMIIENVAFTDWAGEYVYKEGVGKKFPRGTAIYAFLYLIWKAAPDVAVRFVEEVVAGGGAKGDPIREFVDFFKDHRAIQSNGDPFHQYLNFYIRCWNCWYGNKSMKRRYSGSQTTMFKVACLDQEDEEGLRIFSVEFPTVNLDRFLKKSFGE